MFLPFSSTLISEMGFPRIRGDVPALLSLYTTHVRFSPHTRGCSAVCNTERFSVLVFPAYAGMFRSPSPWRRIQWRFPRIRGDVPHGETTRKQSRPFSPHTRGCSLTSISLAFQTIVFPAYAGMFLRNRYHIERRRCFPRIRGDVPSKGYLRRCLGKFSPHTRGCSYRISNVLHIELVFPAYAGMFLCKKVDNGNLLSFPRIRGDVPSLREILMSITEFSPHTRGCSRVRQNVDFNLSSFPRIRGDVPVSGRTLISISVVFPAYAGMFLLLADPADIRMRFPRIRGDVPSSFSNTALNVSFSPHTRGCSLEN